MEKVVFLFLLFSLFIEVDGLVARERDIVLSDIRFNG